MSTSSRHGVDAVADDAARRAAGRGDELAGDDQKPVVLALKKGLHDH